MNWHELFTYDEATGNLIWKSRPLADFGNVANCVMWNTRFAGTVAGCRRKTKVRRCGIWIGIVTDGSKKFHAAHIIVWEMHNGAWQLHTSWDCLCASKEPCNSKVC